MAVSESNDPTTAVPPYRPSAFGALRHRNFRLFFFGQATSLLGTWAQTIAQSWLVLILTNSAFAVGLVTALSSLPVLLFSLPAGVIADRVSKHRMVIATQSVSMLLAAVFVVLYFTHRITVPYIMILATLLGVVNAFDIPARQSFLIEMVGKEDLTTAIALNSTSFNATRVIGPAIAGVLIAQLGVGACFIANTVSFVAVIVALLAMRLPPFQPSATHPPVWAQLREGLAYVMGDRRVRTLVGLIALLAVFGFQFLTLLPVFARDVLGRGAVEYGWLMSAVGFGALAGALGIATFARHLRKGLVLTWSATTYGLIVTAFALSRNLALSLVLLVVGGFGMIVNAAMVNVTLQALAPDALRGRVLSVYTFAFIGLAPLGALQAGALAERFGAPFAVIAGGMVCTVVAGLAVWRGKELRETA
jgi:MFS family permease